MNMQEVKPDPIASFLPPKKGQFKAQKAPYSGVVLRDTS
jgi:hypothetical protein